MEDVYICSSYRTTLGKIYGQYSKTPAVELGSKVLSKCIETASIEPHELSQVIIGQTFTAGQGQNPARQTTIMSKLPPEVSAYTINMITGSSLRAVYDGYSGIRTGAFSIAYAGGQDNATLANHSVNLRLNEEIGHIQWKDTVISDGLTDAFVNLQMGDIADHLSHAFIVSRPLQDKFALMSQTRALRAIENEYFQNEIVCLNSDDVDEYPWKNVTLDQLANLPTLFSSESATITSGNSADLSDGAAGVLLVSQSEITRKNIVPQARIVAISQIGCEPIEMGRAAIKAIETVCKKVNWSYDMIDLFEIDENFSVQAMICIDYLNLDLEKVNVSGGSIALGNPMAANGCRILVTLIHNLNRLDKNRGVAAVCIGGGMGIGIAIERNKHW